MMKKLVLALFLLVGTLGFGQIQTLDTPDCQIGLDSDGSSGLLNSKDVDNRTTVCTSWTLVYSSTGFSAASIEFQSAPDSGGAPGAYVTWANIDSGSSLPLTSTNGGQIMGFRFQPWARIHINSTTGTGRIIARLLGYKPFKGATDPTNGSTNVNVTNSGTGAVQAQGPDPTGTVTASLTGNPVMLGAWNGSQFNRLVCAGSAAQCGFWAGPSSGADGVANNTLGFPYNSGNGGVDAGGLVVAPSVFNGTTWDRQITCPNTTPFSVASTTTQVIALSGSTKIRVCGVALFPSTSTAGAVDLVYGTGASCGTGTTTLTGAVTLPASAVTSISVPIASNGPLTTPSGQALCVRTVTSTVAGYVSWEQH